MRALPYGEAQLEGWLIEPFEDVVVYPGASRGILSLPTSGKVSPQISAPIRLTFEAELYSLDAQPVFGRGEFELATFADVQAEGTFVVVDR